MQKHSSHLNSKIFDKLQVSLTTDDFILVLAMRGISALICASALALVHSSYGQVVLTAKIGTDGSVSLLVNGDAWLNANTTGIFASKQMDTNHNGGIEMQGLTSSQGYDSYGAYDRTAFSWYIPSTKESFGTAVRDYTTTGGNVVIFEQVRERLRQNPLIIRVYCQ